VCSPNDPHRRFVRLSLARERIEVRVACTSKR
jgi:hypothetical protein